MKRLCAILSSLALIAALLCPAAAASGSSVLWVQGSGGSGNVQLTLQNLGAQEVNSVQLELTLEGSYPNASFAGDGNGRYSHCKADASGNRTTVTIYIDSVKTLNQSGTAMLGTLTLGSSCTAPSSARLTVLDHGLNASGSTGSVPVQVNSNGSSGGNNNSSSGSSGSSSKYSVRVGSVEHGSITVRPTSAEAGETVTITTRPDSGYRLSELTVTANRRTISLSDKGNGVYSFAMPGSSVEIQGAFTAGASTPVELPFTDVAAGVWYYDAVEYVYEHGLMAGTGASTFSPELFTSRGMIVTILHRMAGSPAAGSSAFLDVSAGQYYADAVAWAAANGVVSGYGDGRFGPNDSITREQMVVILQGFARLQGWDVSNRADLSIYEDAGSISGYAVEAMRWARSEGLINGTSATTLTPTGTTTRAQAAVILRGFCEKWSFGG